MSHFTTLAKVKIIDTAAFIAAAAELGFEHVVGATKCKGYMGNTTEVDVLVRKKGCMYDIGLKKRDDGGYDAISDWTMLGGNIGPRINALTVKHTVTRKYKKMGFFASVKTDTKGNILVKLTR